MTGRPKLYIRSRNRQMSSQRESLGLFGVTLRRQLHAGRQPTGGPDGYESTKGREEGREAGHEGIEESVNAQRQCRQDRDRVDADRCQGCVLDGQEAAAQAQNGEDEECGEEGGRWPGSGGCGDGCGAGGAEVAEAKAAFQIIPGGDGPNAGRFACRAGMTVGRQRLAALPTAPPRVRTGLLRSQTRSEERRRGKDGGWRG